MLDLESTTSFVIPCNSLLVWKFIPCYPTYHALAQRISLFTVTISMRVGYLWKVMVLEHQFISIAVKKFRNAKPFEIINDPNLSRFFLVKSLFIVENFCWPQALGLPTGRSWCRRFACPSVKIGRTWRWHPSYPVLWVYFWMLFLWKLPSAHLGVLSVVLADGQIHIVPKTRPHITAAANFGVETRDGGRWVPRFQRKACSQREGWRLSHLRRSGYGDPMENGPT